MVSGRDAAPRRLPRAVQDTIGKDRGFVPQEAPRSRCLGCCSAERVGRSRGGTPRTRRGRGVRDLPRRHGRHQSGTDVLPERMRQQLPHRMQYVRWLCLSAGLMLLAYPIHIGMHAHTVKVFGESRKQSKENIICPLCRHDWGDLALVSLKKEIEVANRAPNVHKNTSCRQCQTKPIRSARYLCVQCKSTNLCERCFSESELHLRRTAQRIAHSCEWRCVCRIGGSQQALLCHEEERGGFVGSSGS